MTEMFEKASSLPSATNGGILRSLTLPLNDVHKCKCGGAWTREGRPLLRHPREAGIPYAGQSSTSSFPRCNQRGDSRAERENDSRV